jgi:ABC-type Zn uptake system ZnuABC Zn-binding protein ZnuA
MLGAETLFNLARGHRFWDFAASQEFGGRPLADYVGGWLAQAAPFRGGRMVCYHKNWAYFAARFQVECAMYVERRPGIPPSPGHVREVIDFIRSSDIPVIFAANYYSRSQVERVGSRTGAEVVMVPFHEGGEEGVEGYFDLVDTWVSRLADAFERHNAARADHN